VSTNRSSSHMYILWQCRLFYSNVITALQQYIGLL